MQKWHKTCETCLKQVLRWGSQLLQALYCFNLCRIPYTWVGLRWSNKMAPRNVFLWQWLVYAGIGHGSVTLMHWLRVMFTTCRMFKYVQPSCAATRKMPLLGNRLHQHSCLPFMQWPGRRSCMWSCPAIHVNIHAGMVEDWLTGTVACQQTWSWPDLPAISFEHRSWFGAICLSGPSPYLAFGFGTGNVRFHDSTYDINHACMLVCFLIFIHCVRLQHAWSSLVL